MKSINTENCIVPIGEFKAKASRILKDLKTGSSPLVVTQNGRAAAVVLSPKAFDDLRERNRVLEAIAEGIADAESGQLIEHQEVKSWLGSWGSSAETNSPE